jgi:hypothetical protein
MQLETRVKDLEDEVNNIKSLNHRYLPPLSTPRLSPNLIVQSSSSIGIFPLRSAAFNQTHYKITIR